MAGASGARALRRAWIWLALTFPGVIVGIVMAESLVAALGYDETHGEAIPLGVKVLAGLTAFLFLAVPAVLAIVYGQQARSRGRPVGLVPIVVAGALLAYMVVVSPVGAVLGARVG